MSQRVTVAELEARLDALERRVAALEAALAAPALVARPKRPRAARLVLIKPPLPDAA
jgi:hypothetical protein